MTDDIRFKITADEQGAVASFKRLRNEVLNNENGLKSIGQEGRSSGKALKDMASFLGPEFQVLGDRIDHVSGALTDVKDAGMLAKASLVGLVATGGFQVGKMLGDLIFQTEAFNQHVADMKVEFTELDRKLADFVAKQYGKQIAASVRLDTEGGFEAALFGTDATIEQLDKELQGISGRLARSAEVGGKNVGQVWVENFERMREEVGSAGAFFGAIGATSVASFEQALNYMSDPAPLKLTKEQIEADKARYDQLLKMRDELIKKNQEEEKATAAIDRQAQATQRLKDAESERAKAIEQQRLEQERMVDSQVDYLANLQLELVRVRDGDEAYERAKLKRQGFLDWTIDSAVNLRRMIDDAKKLKETPMGPEQFSGTLPQAPGMIQATQQRFMTRGTGSSVQDKILQEMKQQIKIQQELLVATRKTNEKLSKIPTEEA